MPNDVVAVYQLVGAEAVSDPNEDAVRPTSLDDELRECRDKLDAADAETMALARGGACELAVRASLALAVERGSSSVISGGIAERSVREAALLLTFGSRPAIRRELLQQFGVAE